MPITPGAISEFAGVSVITLLSGNSPITVTTTESGAELCVGDDCITRIRIDHSLIPLDASVKLQVRMKSDGVATVHAELAEVDGNYVPNSEVTSNSEDVYDILESPDFRENLVSVEQELCLTAWLSGAGSAGYIYSAMLVIER